MKHYLLVIFIALSLIRLKATAITFNNESLNYKVMYKWGFVNKQAGTTTISILNQDENYITRLVARSDPWADKFFMVRDTLNGIIKKDGFKPIFYEKKAHEGSEFKHDIVKYSYNGNNAIGNCTRIKRKKGKTETKKEHVISASGITVDILSVFYYMRYINFNSLNPGNIIRLNVFSGKRKELLTIKYLGTENIAYDNKNYNCYHISFTFTSKGGEKTSEDMDAWISTDNSRIPIKLEGTLVVGKVQCFYTGKS